MTNPNNRKPHFVLIPLLAQGHIIPMVDMAHLLAERGVLVSFITTPVNATRIKPTIARAKASGLSIQFVEFKFPTSRDIPEGYENFDQLPSQDLYKPMFEAISFLQTPLELYLRVTRPRPNCITSDYCNYWTMDIAQELKIPRFIFHGPSCFFILSSNNIRQYKAYEGVDDENESVIVPNLPQEIKITRAQAPGWFSEPIMEKLRENIFNSEAAANGIVVNSFYELEHEYFDRYSYEIRKIVWPIGPVSIYNKDIVDRGNKASIDANKVLSWLDSKEPRSVLYVSFGSIVKTWPSQLIEIGCGLEASNRPFIWVIKEAEICEEVQKWMAEGFEQRTGERSLIITGWAPQILILSHYSIGGFMTHCGWNSVLEAVSAGVPMITCPYFVDQFLNERLVVEVLKVGVDIGIKKPFYNIKEGEMQLKREDVKNAILRLMDGGDESAQRREKAREFGEKAHKAMEEGGSSYGNLTALIEFVLTNARNEL